jgi:hypothetical protein
MPRHRSDTELEALQAQAVALDKKIKEAAARDRVRRETEENRRRMIAGLVALEHMATEPRSAFAATLLGLVNNRARSAADRALFGLSPLSRDETQPAPPAGESGS